MNMHSPVKRIIIGISGASGAVYGIELLRRLQSIGDVETHLTVSKTAQITLSHETGLTLEEVRKMADFYHPVQDLSASIASGSFKTLGMVVAPCSIRSMSEIAAGVTSSLLTRAADVVLKERRRLVLMVRETPFHSGHLRQMLALSEIGAIIAPPIPAFYTMPENIQALVNHSVSRVLDLFDLEDGAISRWEGMPQKKKEPV